MVVIIFFFLRNWRTTLIPIIVIPVSLIGSFFIMYLAGFTINVLTLLAIVLAIGLVVDDAIVMMENIYVKIEEGMSPMEAGLKGSKEIFFAIIATTITLIAVFFPIVFLEGMTGRLFREFSIVHCRSRCHFCLCCPYPYPHAFNQNAESPQQSTAGIQGHGKFLC